MLENSVVVILNMITILLLSYVLRQVGIYYSIDQKYASLFTPEERLIFINYLKEIITRFDKYFSAIEKKKKDNLLYYLNGIVI